MKAFCEKHNLWLIEDNCDALGSTYDMPLTQADGSVKVVTKMTGTIGDIGTSSFYSPYHMKIWKYL